MAAYYLDTSAIVKRYVNELGTLWVLSLTEYAARNVLYTVRVAGPELVAALARKVRTGDVSRPAAERAGDSFRQDWRVQYQIVDVTDGLATRAMNLAEKHGLRGYDAVHLAAALEVHDERQASQLPGITFVSADVAQLQAATREGLVADNPSNYP